MFGAKTGFGICLKFGAEVSKCLGAEVSGHFSTNFVVPKCLVAEVPGSLHRHTHILSAYSDPVPSSSVDT